MCIRDRLDGAFAASEKLAHDVGFVWSLASVADYRLTGDETARRRALRAATVLMARFNPTGSFLRSWNDLPGKDTRGWTIADNMMNLPLLYCASGTTGDSRFEDVARRHTDTVIQHLLREDGSANHIICLLYTSRENTTCKRITPCSRHILACQKYKDR